jgi:hypothetical protein
MATVVRTETGRPEDLPMCIACLPLLSALLSLPAAPLPAETHDDEQALQAAAIPSDGPGLVAFFRKQVPGPADQVEIARLVEQLADKAFRVRQKASADLLARGGKAVPQLRQALGNPDGEVRRRAAACLANIEQRRGAEQMAAAVRVLRARRPPGATAALLNYLVIADPAVEDEIMVTLCTLGPGDTKARSELASDLRDAAPARRAAAALLLGRAGSAEQRAAVRPLLKDPEPKVRLRAAQGLILAHDKAGVPALVALLDTAPLDLAYQAEDWLGGVAGPKVEAPGLGDNRAARAKCRAAWEAWWQKSASRLDLTRVDLAMLFNPVIQARDVARRWLEAYARGDLNAMKRTMRFPLSLEGERMTAQQFDDLFKEIVTMLKTEEVSFNVLRVGRFDEYLNMVANKRVKDSFDDLRRSQVLVVYVRAKMSSQPRPSDGAVLVQLVQGQPRVVGLGPAGKEAGRP